MVMSYRGTHTHTHKHKSAHTYIHTQTITHYYRTIAEKAACVIADMIPVDIIADEMS